MAECGVRISVRSELERELERESGRVREIKSESENQNQRVRLQDIEFGCIERFGFDDHCRCGGAKAK